MRRAARVWLVIAFAAGAIIPGTVVAGPTDSVNLGVGGVVRLMKNCKANVYIVEYEHPFDANLSFVGRGSAVNYKFTDGHYTEDGRPRGVEAGVRYYFTGDSQGYFIGGTVGYWHTDWTFTSGKNTPVEALGTGRTKSLRTNLDLGVRIPIASSSVSLLPKLNFGRFFASSKCEYTSPASRVGTACNQEPEVASFYIYLAVLVGIGF